MEKSIWPNDRMKNTIRIVLLIIVILIDGFGVLHAFSPHSNMPPEYTEFDAGWSVEFDGEVYETDDIRDFDFTGFVKKNHPITLQNTLPDQVRGYESMVFSIRYCAMSFAVDDKEIYTYGTSTYESGGMVGCGYQFVTLPEEGDAATVTITLYPTIDDAFVSLGDFCIMSNEYTQYYIVGQEKPSLFIGCFLIMTGALMLMMGIAFSFANRRAIVVLPFALLNLLVGGWTLAASGVLQALVYNLQLIAEVKLICFYFGPIPFIMMLARTYGRKWSIKKKLLVVTAVLNLTFAVTATLLHFSDILYLPEVTEIAYVILAIDAVVILATKKTPIHKQTFIERIFTIAIYQFIGMCMIDAGFHVYNACIAKTSLFVYRTIFSYGALVLILMFMFAIMLIFYQHVTQLVEKQALERMAYHDELTGLYNRAWASERFDYLEAHPELHYSILSFDLNGLKRVNDSFGHQQGDLLICVFANLLKECFKGIGDCVRNGGDEFMVLVDESNRDEIEHAVQRVRELEQYESEALPYKVESSYGIASTTEAELSTVDDVLMKADERMYEMKKQMHATRE